MHGEFCSDYTQTHPDPVFRAAHFMNLVMGKKTEDVLMLHFKAFYVEMQNFGLVI